MLRFKSGSGSGAPAAIGPLALTKGCGRRRLGDRRVTAGWTGAVHSLERDQMAAVIDHRYIHLELEQLRLFLCGADHHPGAGKSQPHLVAQQSGAARLASLPEGPPAAESAGCPGISPAAVAPGAAIPRSRKTPLEPLVKIAVAKSLEKGRSDHVCAAVSSFRRASDARPGPGFSFPSC